MKFAVLGLLLPAVALVQGLDRQIGAAARWSRTTAGRGGPAQRSRVAVWPRTPFTLAIGVVASSDGLENSNAIDPGVFLDPSDGRLP